MNKDAIDFCKNMTEIREIEKEVNTYYEGIKKYVYTWDNCVHPSFSHCGYGNDHDGVSGGTQTGRLSCTKPNLQNVPRDGKIKDHFVSRFGSSGRIICCDFSQIEVIAFAFLTKDPQLIQDLKDGLDIHCVTATEVYEEVVNKKLSDGTDDPRRQTIKPLVFLMIYGGSANKMAKTHNLDLDFCKKVIEKFYKRYPAAKEWQDRQVKIVEGNKYLIDEFTPKGFVKHESFLTNITGRKLYFKTTDAPKFLVDKGINTGFNPSEIKNYPVQSLATADIALMMHGLLWREAIKHRDKFLLINQIHDDVVVDCRQEHVDFYCSLAKKILTNIKEPFLKYFSIDFNLDIMVEFKVGNPSWGSCKKYEFNNQEVKNVTNN